VHILDDGFQHRSLARQFELVLVTEADLADTVLPAGNLREPLAALRRADALAVREEELDVVGDRLRALGATDVPLWTVRRSLRFPAPLGVFGAGLRPLAFCGVARPENFAAMLTGAGCGLVDTVIFDDHHRYVDRDLALLIRVAKQMTATGLVTTEKDAVKLSAAMRARLEAEVGPLMVVRLEANFVFESPVVRTLENRLRAAGAERKEAEAHVR
jgi:tetraacyldisaccharide 4'-kinase